MANDYALFIVVVPNDFEMASSSVATSEETNVLVVQEEATKPTVEPLSGLMALAAIPLPIAPAIVPIAEGKAGYESLIDQLPSSMSLCVVLQNYFAERSDIDTIWLASDDKKTFQITFYVEFGCVSDRMLQDLTKLGVGVRNGTKIFVLPTTIVLKGRIDERSDSSLSLHSSTEDKNNLIANKSSIVSEEGDTNQANPLPLNSLSLSDKIRKRIQESDFKKSVRARLMVHQVVASIQASSAISFDFVLLICLASMLAALGLLENSSVIIVASMLVSPLMNPILGIVFGLSVRDHSLWQRGLRNEIIGLIICMTCGFILGLFTTYFETKWGSSLSFPTSEMKSRGDIKHIWVGVLIALPSGAGVALSVLGGNTGSLVGVAISASLLPPAVNCGLLFAYALLGKLFPGIIGTHPLTVEKTNESFHSSLNCLKYTNNEYVPYYTCNLATEAAILACCSLFLTVVNIVCIVIMALIIFRIKEVAPLRQANKDVARFFHYDVKVARDYNKTIHEEDSSVIDSTATTAYGNQLAQSIINRWKTFKSSTIPQPNTVATSSSINLDSELANQNNIPLPTDMESRRKLFRFKSFAKEYDLDIFNDEDYNLTTHDSREKVRLLIMDLIDMCQEIPSVSLDLYRLQPSSIHLSSTDKELTLFYQEMIEFLPPKWHQLFIYEQKRPRMTSWPFTFERSYSMDSHQLGSCHQPIADLNNDQHHQSLEKPNKKSRVRFTRQSSVPESNVSSITALQETELPVPSARFRITKIVPAIPDNTENHESKLI